jgi:hypothetical protein
LLKFLRCKIFAWHGIKHFFISLTLFFPKKITITTNFPLKCSLSKRFRTVRMYHYTKFLLKSSSDFWQGDFYQVRKEFLTSLPIKVPDESTVSCFTEVSSLAKQVLNGETSKITQIEEKLYKLYDIQSKQSNVQEYLQARI